MKSSPIKKIVNWVCSSLPTSTGLNQIYCISHLREPSSLPLSVVKDEGNQSGSISFTHEWIWRVNEISETISFPFPGDSYWWQKLVSWYNTLTFSFKDVNLTDADGNTSVHIAADIGNENFIKTLLNSSRPSPDLNIQNLTDQETALHIAAKKINSESDRTKFIRCCSLLLASGADPNIANKEDRSLLDYLDVVGNQLNLIEE